MFLDIFAGRSKNAWDSPRGCLMFSFTLQMEDGKMVPSAQYVMSLAVTEAIKDICDQKVSLSSHPLLPIWIYFP